MNEEEMKQLLKEMQANCVKGMLKGAIYEDEKAEQKAIAIDLALNLIETQKAEIEKLEKQSKNLDKEAQAYFEESIGDNGFKNRTIALLQAELEKKDKRISDLEFALIDMVLQFADYDNEQINTMGLSALEIAFAELDLCDSIDTKEVHKKYAELAAKYYGLAEEEK